MTPSQTIGPFFGFGLPWPAGPLVVPAQTPGAVRLFGRVLDGKGEPITDALVESWQCDADGRYAGGGAASWFRGFGRCPTDRDGAFAILTVKPGTIRIANFVHAPHVLLSVHARGLAGSACRREIYFPRRAGGERRRSRSLAAVADGAQRATLIAAATNEGGYRFDIRLQGEDETVFFDVFETPSALVGSPPGLFDGVLARGAVRGATSDRAWLQAMLDVEAALARAGARAGLFSPAIAEEIAHACRAENFDVAAIGHAAAATGNPVPALVRALTARVAGAAGGEIHRGATSQDIIDTAAMLIVRRALAPLIADIDGAARAAARLAARHRQTLMAGRTLLQQALPITFGLKAAGWLSALDGAAARLEEIARAHLAVQLGGAAGTLASLGTAGPAVVGFLGEELGLAVPLLPWHSARERVADLAAALGVAAGAIGKIARDVTLLAQTEVGEAHERERANDERAAWHRARGRGAGCTQPARRLVDVAPQEQPGRVAISATACAARAPGLVATQLAAMVQEHERAAGAWHAEWRPLNDLMVTVGSAAAWLRDCLERLTVDEGRMRANLGATHGLLLSERVTAALAPHVGRLAAHDLVTDACAEAAAGPRALAEVLAARPAITAWLSLLGDRRAARSVGLPRQHAALLRSRAAGPRRAPGRCRRARRGLAAVSAPVAVHHQVDGPPDAPVLVLSGSLGSALEMWDPQMPALIRHFRVVRYDLRGHGRSPVPPGPYEIADLGADLIALLDRLGVARAHLCGLSLGGMLSLWTAAHHPERVDRLVVMCTSALLGPPEMWIERAAVVSERGTSAVADTVVARWFTPALQRRAPELVAQMRAMLVATPAAGYAACCGADPAQRDLRAELAADRRRPRWRSPARRIHRRRPRTSSRIAERRSSGCHLAVVDERGAPVPTSSNLERASALILAHLRGDAEAPSPTAQRQE